ncbi:MAG TPA: RNA methyltransferase [Caulobacterales bacterium]|nr:RNA methyltransferase [Caulobacterales bacterium]
MLHKVSSAANPLVKMLKSLHAKKGRAETGLFLAEGARLVEEAAQLGKWPDVLALAPPALERGQTRALVARAEAAGVRCLETSEAVLGQIAKRDNPQTMIGAYRRFDTALARLEAKPGQLWVALEAVRDPGNLGTILRTADAAGAAGVILVGGTCDPFSVEAVRASMGAIFAAPFAQTDLVALDAWRRAGALPLFGASLNGRARHDEAPAEGGAILLLGNEQAGLSPEAEALCDALVRLPMRGKADSLNLAAAAAILLYDFWRRRGYDGAH